MKLEYCPVLHAQSSDGLIMVYKNWISDTFAIWTSLFLQWHKQGKYGALWVELCVAEWRTVPSWITWTIFLEFKARFLPWCCAQAHLSQIGFITGAASVYHCHTLQMRIRPKWTAGTGLGKEISLVLALEGAEVFLADVNVQGIKVVAEKIWQEGRKALVIHLDVTQEEAVQTAVKKAVAEFGSTGN